MRKGAERARVHVRTSSGHDPLVGVSQNGSRERCLPISSENETEENGKNGRNRNPEKQQKQEKQEKRKKRKKKEKNGRKKTKNGRKKKETEEKRKNGRNSIDHPFCEIPISGQQCNTITGPAAGIPPTPDRAPNPHLLEKRVSGSKSPHVSPRPGKGSFLSKKFRVESPLVYPYPKNTRNSDHGLSFPSPETQTMV